VQISMLSIFQATTGGDDWRNFIDVFEGHSSYFWHTAAFCIYVAFATLVMLNLVTGVFVEGAQRIIKQDKDVELIKTVCTIFNHIDTDESMTITRSEFMTHLDKGIMDTYFEALELSKGQAHEIFELLDIDGDTTLSVEEFVKGCMRLRGPARSIDISSLAHDSHIRGNRTNEYLDKILSEVKKVVRSTALLDRRSRPPGGKVSHRMPSLVPQPGTRMVSEFQQRMFGTNDNLSAHDGKDGMSNTPSLGAETLDDYIGTASAPSSSFVRLMSIPSD